MRLQSILQGWLVSFPSSAQLRTVQLRPREIRIMPAISDLTKFESLHHVTIRRKIHGGLIGGSRDPSDNYPSNISILLG
jgi:hypothetical protein